MEPRLVADLVNVQLNAYELPPRTTAQGSLVMKPCWLVAALEDYSTSHRLQYFIFSCDLSFGLCLMWMTLVCGTTCRAQRSDRQNVVAKIAQIAYVYHRFPSTHPFVFLALNNSQKSGDYSNTNVPSYLSGAWATARGAFPLSSRRRHPSLSVDSQCL